MKTFLLVALAVVAGIIILANLGPMILLAVSIIVSYYAVKKFILTDSVVEKILWGFVILIGISLSLSNVPALIGVASFVILYYAYKKWKEDRKEHYSEDEFLMTNK
ncbi:flagellar basal body rod protein [Aquibacillus koreensis]|uniref:Flagellar basal body rod protein n=1 Tax=Aquibacillus koreensis TaxID=279446 RepID=A0A9X3WLK4_9BACI|nr:flagellar basal body rod protein [Aquibacillus koreensis]MCT2538213.1 flagellar basal body rod protein [Aquibacillus koreensis]MDC3420843.1 flagellar basal body rod protein [Aquibacillus koreensis]